MRWPAFYAAPAPLAKQGDEIGHAAVVSGLLDPALSLATGKHKLRVSYTMTRNVLIGRGLVTAAPGRGKYRRRRERRPMVGMMVHLDGSTHTWIPGLPQRDLVAALDDADGRLLFARFFEQEGTMSTLLRCGTWWCALAGSASCTPTEAVTSASPGMRAASRRLRKPIRWAGCYGHLGYPDSGALTGGART